MIARVIPESRVVVRELLPPGGGVWRSGRLGLGAQVGPVHGENLVELLLEPFHGDLHEILGAYELL
jgi:hypothetical protein